jgi:hypothetical protein
MDLTDDLKEASESEVIAWFDARPELRELLIHDMRTNLGLPFLKEFKYVFDHTDFWIHPTVGVVPNYSLVDSEFQFGEVEEKPDWESRGNFENFGRRIYKRLWFVIWIKIDHGEIDSGINHLSRYKEIEKEFIDEDAIYFNDFEDYYYGWQERTFSDGRRFVEIKDISNLNEADLIECDEMSEITSPSPDDEIEISVSILRSVDGRIFAAIHFFGGLHLLEASSVEEAEKILHEIWG